MKPLVFNTVSLINRLITQQLEDNKCTSANQVCCCKCFTLYSAHDMFLISHGKTCLWYQYVRVSLHINLWTYWRIFI